MGNTINDPLLIRKSYMIFALHIIKLLSFAASATISNSSPETAQSALQKSLVKNLNSRYAGIEMPTAMVKTFDLNDRASNQAHGGFNDISHEVQGYILAFLSPRDLLNTNLVNPLYYNLSNHITFLHLKNQSPNFVLENNWMNMALSDFLHKYFENSIFNIDDLMMAVYEIIIRKKEENQHPGVGTLTLRLLDFVYEFQNGPNSYRPFMAIDYFVEVVRKCSKSSLPKFFKFMFRNFNVMAHNNGLDLEEYKNYMNDLFKLYASGAKVEEIMAFLNFDPAQSMFDSDFIRLPSFLKIAFFDILLPVCEDEDRFEEAIEIISPCLVFSQTLFDQIDLKFPLLLIQINESMDTHLGCRFQPLRKALIKRFPRHEVIGLDYLVTRDSANPFDLMELLKLNPDYELLIKKFISTCTGTLIELDIIAEMKEAGLFSGIRDLSLLRKINSLLSGKFCPESAFASIL